MSTGYQIMERMTTAQLRAEIAASHKRNKYYAKPTEVDGIRFASKKEAQRFSELQLRQKAGEISDLTAHPSWPLTINGHKIGRYTADASYKDAFGRLRVVDFKSPATARTEAFNLRRKLMLAIHNITVEVVF